ncbi:MAG TPA: penicillin-binding protein 2 [Actinocrinis sp.]|nr:penicillin-binding protein 2 [Actinocrinis sp.]
MNGRTMNVSRTRLALVQVLAVALLATLGARLWYLQVHSGSQFQAAAAANDLRIVATPAVRGDILDDKGVPLVANTTVLEVTADMSTLSTQPDGGKAVLTKVAAALGVPETELAQNARLCSATVSKPCWAGSPYQPVPIAADVPVSNAVQLMEEREKYPGIAVTPIADRTYPSPNGITAAQILGYLSPVTPTELDAPNSAFQPTDLVGRAGLESSYDTQLRGTTGVQKVAVDNLGHAVRTVADNPSMPGDDLITTLDSKVQAVAEQQLSAAILAARGRAGDNGPYKADSGAVVVMDVNTGAVIAMATYPTYSPTVWSGGISSQDYAHLIDPNAGTPLLDRAYQGQFAPGSTFKGVTTSAMLQDGFPANGIYDCSTTFSAGGAPFHNFEGEAYGPITLKQAIEVSCDTVFYRVAYDMWLKDGGNKPVAHPLDPVQTMAKAYGLGKPTGLDLPGEAAGDIQTRQEKLTTWQQNKDVWCSQAQTGFPDVQATDPARALYLKQVASENCQDGYQFRGGDAIIEAIGQGGILVTPLQLAQVYAAIANGGTVYQPHLEKALVAPDGHVVSTYAPKITEHVPISPATDAFLINAFEGVAQEGTASGVYGGWPQNVIPVGAKTGTADVYGTDATSVFTSFLPANHPQYVVAMEVSQAGQGALTSGPAVEAIEAAMYGVQKGKVVPAAALLPTPPTMLPPLPGAVQTAVPGPGAPAAPASFSYQEPLDPAADAAAYQAAEQVTDGSRSHGAAPSAPIDAALQQSLFRPERNIQLTGLIGAKA